MKADDITCGDPSCLVAHKSIPLACYSCNSREVAAEYLTEEQVVILHCVRCDGFVVLLDIAPGSAPDSVHRIERLIKARNEAEDANKAFSHMMEYAEQLADLEKSGDGEVREA